MLSTAGLFLIRVVLGVLVVAFSVLLVVGIGLGAIIYEGWVKEPQRREYAL